MRGHVDVVTRSWLLGWAADPAAPTREMELEVRVNGRLHGRVRANQERDNLRTLFPGATGRYGFHYEFEWPLSPFERHEVEIAARSGQPIPNGKQVIPAVGTSPPVAIPRSSASNLPVLVTSTGRAGSSLCMARLAVHPSIAVAGDHPHEILLVSYYALALRTLISEADRARSMEPSAMVGRDHRFRVGFNPYNESIVGAEPVAAHYWNNRVPKRLAVTFAALIRDYYEAMLPQKPHARYFAEKSNPGPLVRRAARKMFGEVREIALIRDPRDLVCSYRSFWKTTAEAAIPAIRSQLEQLRLLREKNPPDTLFIHYEDLILQQEATMGLIWRFLDLEAPAASEGASEHALFERHGTSKSAAQSVGRWRHELTEAEIEHCQQRFAGILQSFGYEV